MPCHHYLEQILILSRSSPPTSRRSGSLEDCYFVVSAFAGTVAVHSSAFANPDKLG